MPVTRTRAFKSGDGEAIRIPRGLAFGEGAELVIIRSGDVMTIYPARALVAGMIAALEKMPKPSEIETRDEEEIAERPGL